jgi:hypothetical protein
MMPLNGKLGSSSRGTARNAESMGKNFTAEYKSSAPKSGSSGAQDGNVLKQLAKKKAEAAMQNPKRSPGTPQTRRPAGTVDIGMGMGTPKRPAAPGGTAPGNPTPKQPAPGGFGKGNPTPKRPGGTFRMN